MLPPHIATKVPSGPPRNLLWTVDQFHYLGSLGMFEGRRAMLIGGVIVEEGQEPPTHCCARSLVTEVFYHAFADCHLCQRAPLVLGVDTDPVPDVMVVPGPIRNYSTAHPTTAVFMVELADYSVVFDTTTKAEIYARAAVPDYWVVDLESRRLLVFRDPVAGPDRGAAYRIHLTLDAEDTVAPLAAPNAAVKVADLLP